jgi:hypothetical protein
MVLLKKVVEDIDFEEEKDSQSGFSLTIDSGSHYSATI